MYKPKYFYYIKACISGIIDTPNEDYSYEVTSVEYDFDKSIETFTGVLLDHIDYNFKTDKIPDGISAWVEILKVSMDKLIFETSKELMDYFNNHIQEQTKETLYDFLMQFVDDFYVFDIDGNIIDHHYIEPQEIRSFVGARIEFDEESCRSEGKYKFYIQSTMKDPSIRDYDWEYL